MSKVNSKNFIKDTNYNDFVQKEIGLNIVSERASSADVSFNIEKKSDQKLKVKFNEPRFGNQVGQLLETSELSAVPGSFGNFQLFKIIFKTTLLTVLYLITTHTMKKLAILM